MSGRHTLAQTCYCLNLISVSKLPQWRGLAQKCRALIVNPALMRWLSQADIEDCSGLNKSEPGTLITRYPRCPILVVSLAYPNADVTSRQHVRLKLPAGHARVATEAG